MIDEHGVEREDCLVHLPEDVQFTSPDHLFMKGMIMDKAGIVVGQHAHEYGHTSLLARGRCRVMVEGAEHGVEYTAPAFIWIPAKTKHRFVSLEDNTHVYCIHNMADYHILNGDKPMIHGENRLADVAAAVSLSGGA